MKNCIALENLEDSSSSRDLLNTFPEAYNFPSNPNPKSTLLYNIYF